MGRAASIDTVRLIRKQWKERKNTSRAALAREHGLDTRVVSAIIAGKGPYSRAAITTAVLAAKHDFTIHLPYLKGMPLSEVPSAEDGNYWSQPKHVARYGDQRLADLQVNYEKETHKAL